MRSDLPLSSELKKELAVLEHALLPELLEEKWRVEARGDTVVTATRLVVVLSDEKVGEYHNLVLLAEVEGFDVLNRTTKTSRRLTTALVQVVLFEGVIVRIRSIRED